MIMRSIFENHEIFRKSDAGGGLMPLKLWKSDGVAIAMSCGAPTYHYTWLVEWLHRRVISSAGAIAPRIGLQQSMRFRSLTLIFDIENDVIRNSV